MLFPRALPDNHVSTVRDAKRLRRKLKRHWRKTRSEPDREAYRSQCQVVRDELVKAKSEHYHNKLSEADKHKNVYLISLLFGPKVQKLPAHNSVQDLSEQFADYFFQKIVTIRNGLCQNINTDNQCDETDVISISRVTKASNKRGNIENNSFISIKIVWSGPYSHLAFEALFVWIVTCHRIYR